MNQSIKVALRITQKSTEAVCGPILQLENTNLDIFFDEKRAQAKIFDECVKDMMISSLYGRNCSVIIYGENKSGKTFTSGILPYALEFEDGLIKIEEYHGLLPRCINEVLTFQEKQKNLRFDFFLSFLLLENEKLIDLLDENKSEFS